MAPGGSKRDRPSSATPGGEDRRANLTLRELLDELIELTRHLSRQAGRMSADELAYSRERMEWLAAEIWEQATRQN